jgi:hypothetical protein
MTIEQFKLLHEYEQEEIVYQKSAFIGNYVRGNKICDVYQLFSFYVKFCYSLSLNDKGVITPFLSPDNLPFLKEIDLSGL